MAWSFSAPKGGRLRRSNFRKFWNRARDAIDMPEPPFTICGTGNMMAAAEEASLRELMERGTGLPGAMFLLACRGLSARE